MLLEHWIALIVVALVVGAAAAALLCRARARIERRLAESASASAIAAMETQLEVERVRLAEASRREHLLVSDLAELRRRIDSLSDQRADLAARAERVDSLSQQLKQSDADLRSVRDSRDRLDARSAELAARLQEQQAASEQRLQELREAREQLKVEFQALASEMLEAKSKSLQEVGEQQLGQVLTPLREQLDGFRKMVGDVYEKENNSRVALQSRIDELVGLNRTLGAEAQSLSRALTTDNRTQGYWGELKLERLLESAGLQKGVEYLTQESFRDSEGDRFRPDAVLKLPEGRDIVIDAKVALLDYQRACEDVDDEERQRAMVRHVDAVRSHVRSLGDKDYSQLDGLQSPDLVLMFIPVEAAFLEALRADPKLYDDAFQRRIVLVGPSNLLASLRLIAQIWRSDQQTRNAKEIADRAGKLYDKFVGFADDLGKVGDAIGKAQAAQQAALNKLSQGKGNLVRRVEQLRSLGVSPGKRLPGALLTDDSDDDADALDGPTNE